MYGHGSSSINTFVNTKRCSELSMSSSRYGESSTTSTYLHQKFMRFKSQLEVTPNVLKNYMISKEGGIPEEFARLFAPQPQLAKAEENEPVSPVDVMGSTLDNNANHQSDA
ncbi:hypothetical protein P3L10_025699 [Capsicum annuum]